MHTPLASHPGQDALLHAGPPVHPPGQQLPSGRFRRRLVIALLVVLAVTGAAVGVSLLTGFFLPHPVVAGDPKASGLDESEDPTYARVVKVIRPKRDESVQVVVEQLASVEAFYRADLRARASGIVKAVHKHIGDPVKRGELLVEIDVPDLEKEVAQKHSVVAQRKQELRVARTNLKHAQAQKEIALAAILHRRTEVTQAEATRDLRGKRLARYRELAGKSAIIPDVVDEQERDYLAAKAAVDAAKAAVQKAEADLKEKEASLEAALVEIDLKGALIDVAIKDLERTQALAGYARITAPFDGVITDRLVDPGSFVQNATTGQSEPLLSVSRTDLVTLVARVPDNAAPFITRDTEVSFDVAELPGVTITGRVTRFSPSIQNRDRTMRVEVDVPQDAASLPTLSSRGGESKVRGNGPRLLPGMSGTMYLRLRQLGSGFVLPTAAVYRRSGKPYILEVRDGLTKQTPVRVQLNDGTLAKVAVLKKVGGQEVLQELTGNEEIVASRQLEVGEGQAVKPVLTAW